MPVNFLAEMGGGFGRQLVALKKEHHLFRKLIQILHHKAVDAIVNHVIAAGDVESDHRQAECL